MRPDGFPDLYPTDILFIDIPQDFTRMDLHPICKRYNPSNWINFVNMVTPILFHPLGKCVKIIIHTYDTGFSVNRLVVPDFEFQTSHGRFILRNDNILQKKIAIGSAEVFNIESFHFDFFDQLHLVGIQCIQYIH